MRKFLLFLAASFLLADAPAAATRTLSDMDGTAVNLPVQVAKIADLWAASNHVVLALGGAPRLVATTQSVRDNAWFAKLYPPIAAMPASKGNNALSPEELVALDADLVIVSGKPAAEQYRKDGFLAMNLSFKDYDTMKRSFLLTGEILGGEAEQKARELVALLEQNLNLVKSRTDALPPDKRPRVMHILGGADLYKADGTGTIIDEWIRAAGGTNAIEAQGNMIEISAEQIAAANPDIIITGGNDTAALIARIKADAAFAGTAAVASGRVYGNPKGAFDWARYSAESVLMPLWAARTVHPEMFADIDLGAATREFYAKFFDYNLTEAEIKSIFEALPPPK